MTMMMRRLKKSTDIRYLSNHKIKTLEMPKKKNKIIIIPSILQCVFKMYACVQFSFKNNVSFCFQSLCAKKKMSFVPMKTVSLENILVSVPFCPFSDNYSSFSEFFFFKIFPSLLTGSYCWQTDRFT